MTPQPKSNRQKKALLQHKTKQKLLQEQERLAEEQRLKRQVVLKPKIRNVKTLIEKVFTDTERPNPASPFQPLWDVLHPQKQRLKLSEFNLFKGYLRTLVLHLIDSRVNVFKTKGYSNSLQGPLKIVINLAKYHELALRPIEEWKPASHNTERQLSSLMRHLYAKYDVPRFMDKAWSNDNENHQWWFLHIGSGQNIRTAPHLPVSLTKKQAHYFLQAPKDFEIYGAIRYGQLTIMGANEYICRQILRTRIGVDFAHEDFWHSVFAWFLENPMLDSNQYAPIIDYLYNQKYVASVMNFNGDMVPAQPGLTMKGRDPGNVIRQMEEWHKRTGRERGGNVKSWQSSGISGLTHEEGQNASKKIFTITEICTQHGLVMEGRTMSHCAGSYGYSCAQGNTSIWSLEEGAHKLLTIEVNNKTMQIVQARGRFNARPNQQDHRIMRLWADKANLSISGWMI